MGVMAVEWWLKEKRLARASTGTIKLATPGNISLESYNSDFNTFTSGKNVFCGVLPLLLILNILPLFMIT